MTDLTKINNHPEATFLGKQTDYPSSYDASVLVAVPREFNRSAYGISGTEFVGKDIWHGYEVSFLLTNGLPVVGILKIAYSSASECIVESKSFKLYLNGFNNELLGDTVEVAKKAFLSRLVDDLNRLLGVPIEAYLHLSNGDTSSDFSDYPMLESLVDTSTINCIDHSETPSLLKKSGQSGEVRLASQLLRSRCKVTSQPDWGDVYIYLKGESLPDGVSLLKYLVSFREENHFHEEVCEMIYFRLLEVYKPEELMVACLYTRRGGLDICPVRCSDVSLIPLHLGRVDRLSERSFRQ